MNSRVVARFPLILVGLFIPILLLAQPFRQDLGEYRIVKDGGPLYNSFTGGIDSPVFQFVDVDGDGRPDLFLLDKDRRLILYRNTNTTSSPRFELTSFHFQNLNVGSWFRFVDIDGDGDQDLFCNGPNATVNFHRNTGTATDPHYVLEIETVKDLNSAVILSEEISVPAFADLDGDGDFDFFSGNSVGSIWYYENAGTASTFNFRFVTDRYQSITIIGVGGSAAPWGAGPRKGNQPGGVMEGRLHGAMAIAFGDVDGDGDQDLAWGDFFNKSLYFLRNTGTPVNPQLVLSDSTWPKEAPVLTDGFNMPQLADLNNDGKIDLLVGVLYPSYSLDNFMYYRNDGTKQNHHFVLETRNLIPTLDVGSASSPNVVDVDGDGDLDLVIGSEDGKLAFFGRTGIGGTVSFMHTTDRFVDLPGLFNVSPAFGDLDGDGKLDLLVGDANGRLRLYRGAANFAEDTAFSLRTTSFGQNGAPALVDIDNNGTLDLFVGTGGGRIQYFRRSGTGANAVFELQTAFFDSIVVGDDAKPVFADLDNDGDQDLVVGARDGSIAYFRNDGMTSSFSFKFVKDFFLGINAGARAAPAFAEMDGDGDLDLFLGNIKGGLYFYHNDRVVLSSGRSEQPLSFELRQNYPNPFNPVTLIEFRLAKEESVSLIVYDLLGREVAMLVNKRKPPGLNRASWDATGMRSGVYFCKLRAGETVATKKMILLK